jgi:hypothetical protein
MSILKETIITQAHRSLVTVHCLTSTPTSTFNVYFEVRVEFDIEVEAESES